MQSLYKIKKNNIYYLLLTLSIYFLDRITKFKIINNYNGETYNVNDYINFDLVWNTGIGFGLLSVNSSLIYNLITILIGAIILALIYFALNLNKLDKFSF